MVAMARRPADDDGFFKMAKQAEASHANVVMFVPKCATVQTARFVRDPVSEKSRHSGDFRVQPYTELAVMCVPVESVVFG
uniref:Uncharacterized protein n=1 Tax=Globodera rostochiensis TaxID=31243 RepID=A0A914GVZ8_GLORO